MSPLVTLLRDESPDSRLVGYRSVSDCDCQNVQLKSRDSCNSLESIQTCSERELPGTAVLSFMNELRVCPSCPKVELRLHKAEH